ncbi:hypothetical protein [Paraburkholderia humisilvae]|uniref:hypothetical protein n=1 Tax=Paraburkholderia humisilvae TaxID=627669 RepID=UPI0015829562|nr:hypothetical protein [Paraburkholderia humisilvae]
MLRVTDASLYLPLAALPPALNTLDAPRRQLHALPVRCDPRGSRLGLPDAPAVLK